MSINETITKYMEAKEKERAAKKEADMLRAEIMLFNGKADFETDEYFVAIDCTYKTIIDTDAVKKDFPDFYSVYGKKSASYTVKPRKKADVKTA